MKWLKFKTNISGVLLSALVFVAGNGLALSEHICNTSGAHDFSFFKEVQCNLENPKSSCCTKKPVQKKNCCEHKQFFKKLPIEGFTSKLFKLKPFEKIVINDYLTNNYSSRYKINLVNEISGIPPPDNLFFIKYLLRPTPVELQVFIC